MKKKGIPEFNIAVLGVSKTGKSSLVQRFLNNTFSSNYQPTTKIELYTKVFDLKEQKQADPQLCILNIYDVFPSDHKLLMQNEKMLNPSEKAKKTFMDDKLKDIIDNSGRWNARLGEQDDEEEVKAANPQMQNLKFAIHAYIFVYSVDNPESITQMKFLYELVHSKESSHMKHIQGEKVFKSKLVIVGNKKDNRYGGTGIAKMFQKDSVEMRFMNDVPPENRFFTSAMTNYNVSKVFKKVCEMLFQDRDVVKHLERKEKKEGEAEQAKRKKKSADTGGGFFSCCGSRKDPSASKANKKVATNREYLDSDEDEEESGPLSSKDLPSPEKDDSKKEEGSKCAIF